MNVVFEKERPKGGVVRRLLRWSLFLFLVLAIAGGAAGVVVWGMFSRDLPDFNSLDDYRPKLVTRVFDQSGQLIGEFYRERRIVLPYDRIPPLLVQAVLASEDNRFFEHHGIDYWGIVRAAFTNLKAGRVAQGGSTITQQVAKSLLINEEGYEKGRAKKLSRKIKEAILARRLEQKLQKQDILALYLNHSFLGNNSYGVEAAAENYFRKTVDQMNVAEIALLAGLPQAPSRYSPFQHPERAKARREYVLRRMLEEKYITQAQLDEAKETPITVYPAPDVSREVTPYFTEEVRRQLFAKYGEKRVLEEGLEVWTTVDAERYRAAEDAAYDNLRTVDKRQGYRGPLMTLTSAEETAKFQKAYDEELKRRDRYAHLEDAELYVGVVSKIDRGEKNVYVRIGPHEAVLPLAGMRWARMNDPKGNFDPNFLDDLPKWMKAGDVLLVRTSKYERIEKLGSAAGYMKSVPKDPTVQLVTLEQEPNLETALLSVHARSGYVLAMLGGYSYDRSEFNRAIQSCRQPGSSFKPIIYSAALDKGWTASTKVLDAPVAFDDPEAGRRWKPQNFETKYVGEVTLRTALQNSMNVPAIRVLDGVGISNAVAWAKKLGITTEVRPELGLALGASCVKMTELTGVYQLFANYGARVPQRFITRVVDRDGKVLEDDGWYADPWAGVGLKIERAIRQAAEPPQQIIDRDTAFLTTRLMRNVVNGGTGAAASKLGVPVAGKTGTTNDSFDAWFMGFTTEIVTAAWVGYDDYVYPMKNEQGGRAALPMWLGYMMKAIKGKKTGEFPVPEGVVAVTIDPKTGARARDGTNAVTEYYKLGNEPKDFVATAGEAQMNQFGLEDTR